MAEPAPEPKWDSDVKDTDECQPVRKKEIGGDIVFCKGNQCGEGKECKNLQKRRRPNGPWKKADDPEVYDKDFEYKCECVAK
jgi:hypothetical protein